MNEKAEVKKTGMEQGSQMRITPEEMELIKRTFSGNEMLVRLMRKLFLPELDPKAPIGQMVDLYMTIKVEELSMEDALVKLRARNELISHVDQVLMTIKLISEMTLPDSGEAIARLKKDSAK